MRCTQSAEGRQASELERRTSTWRLANHERSRRLSRRCTCGAAGSRAARVVGDTVEHGLGKQYGLFSNSRAERDERCGERVLAVGKKSIRGVGLLSGSRTSKSRNIRAHGRDCVNIPSRSKCFTCPPCFRRRHLRYRSRLCGDRVGRVSGSVGVVGSPSGPSGSGPKLLVTALNSAPIIFYPTDTFAELEPCSPFTGSFPDGNYACTSKCKMAAKPLSNIHFVGIVAEWLVAVLETYRTRTRFESQRGINQPTTLIRGYRHCAGMPPSVQAAKPARDRGVALFSTANAK